MRPSFIPGTAFCLIVYAGGIFAQNSPDQASQNLEKALKGDLGPLCEIKGKLYAIDNGEESACKVRGGHPVSGARKNLPRFNTLNPRETLFNEPPVPVYHSNDGSISPYDHKDPLAK